MAIQSLVRSIFEKQGIPRKWKPVPPKSKPPKKDRPFLYDKLEKTDIEKVGSFNIYLLIYNNWQLWCCFFFKKNIYQCSFCLMLFSIDVVDYNSVVCMLQGIDNFVIISLVAFVWILLLFEYLQRNTFTVNLHVVNNGIFGNIV